MLLIYLFNLLGYSLYYRYCIIHSDEQIVKQIDSNDYNQNELTEIKIPVQLPYYNNNNSSLRTDGEIELNGIHYNYVKIKIYNDTLHLYCLPNLVKTQLYKDKNSYANLANDLPVSKNSEAAKKNGFSNEYVGQFIQFGISNHVVLLEKDFSNPIYYLSDGYLNLQGKPPKPAA